MFFNIFNKVVLKVELTRSFFCLFLFHFLLVLTNKINCEKLISFPWLQFKFRELKRIDKRKFVREFSQHFRLRQTRTRHALELMGAEKREFVLHLMSW